MSITIDLHNALETAGIPIHGVRMPTEGSFEIDYKTEATAQHLIDGNALRDTYQTEYASRLTTEQTKAVARELMLVRAKNYLSTQLQAPSPNVQTIFNRVKEYVDGDATLSQMISNQIALFNSAYGVTINPAGATAADRARYLVCCQLVLATIA
jgi:hypothetical protein